MRIRTKLLLSVLSLPLLLMACSPEDKQALLQPVPPTIVHVPVRVPLPATLLQPCERPPAAELKTDVDLVNQGLAWKTTAICNENKLSAAAEAQKKPPE